MHFIVTPKPQKPISNTFNPVFADNTHVFNLEMHYCLYSFLEKNVLPDYELWFLITIISCHYTFMSIPDKKARVFDRRLIGND